MTRLRSQKWTSSTMQRRKYNEDGNENMFISKKVLSTSSTFVCVALSFLWKTPQKNNVQLVETETASQLKSFRKTSIQDIIDPFSRTIVRN